ncbi:MAG: phosphohydrolase [Cognatishimia sp.]|uniref:HD domain-containing protein n=1 Tax=Cognatishimia sp. TaxID=2211648 RepID=UPI003B8B57A1
MTNPAMGSLEWGLATKGALNTREKMAMVRNLAFVQSREAIDGLRAKLGWLRPNDVSLDALMPKQTGLTKDALDHAMETHETPLLFHSWRTYFMGRLIAENDGITHDAEMLFAASILHDIALTDSHQQSTDQCCFAISGGERVRNFIQTCGHSHRIADQIGEAIALHLNMHVKRKLHGAEAYLLSRGAVCDLFGAGHRRISKRTMSDLHERYPRHGAIEALGFETLDHYENSRPGFMTSLTGKKRPKTSMYDIFEL